jgi:uncharacterized protein
MQRFTAQNRTTINWASGTSTEIFIYPSNASFADRNFLFRISTATVEAEQSTFTHFKGITRHLMILKGELELIHEGRYSKQMRAFDQDTFSGEWDTRSNGKVTDFNLMLKDGSTGALKHHQLAPGLVVTFSKKTGFYFLYVASGTVTLSIGSTAGTGDLICFENDSALTVHAEKTCDLIEIEVKLTEVSLNTPT